MTERKHPGPWKFGVPATREERSSWWDRQLIMALKARAESLRHYLWASRCDCTRDGLRVVVRCPRCEGLAVDDEARQA